MNEIQARTLREAHDGFVSRISRMTKAQLGSLYRGDLVERGQTVVYGGPASKDELISALVELRYPLAQMNESIHVLYHVDGITSEVCEYCNPKPPCRVCDSTSTCTYEPGQGAIVNGRHVNA